MSHKSIFGAITRVHKPGARVFMAILLVAAVGARWGDLPSLPTREMSLEAQSCGPCPDVCLQPYPDCYYYEYCTVTGPTDWCTYSLTGCPMGEQASGCWCIQNTSPIIIDIAGDGFALTNHLSGVWFPIGPTRDMRNISWTIANSDDAWLVLDRNGNGAIDNGLELFGNYTSQPDPAAGRERNGFAALAEFDTLANGGNADGVIDSRDRMYASLRLWQDINHDGRSSNELHTLPSLDVVGIDLNYKESKYVDEFGNAFLYRAKVSSSRHGTPGKWAYDVFLKSTPRVRLRTQALR